MGDTMKTIDVKSMLTGFLLCACGFLFMGQFGGKYSKDAKLNMNPSGKFQLVMDEKAGSFLLDTIRGDVYKAEKLNGWENPSNWTKVHISFPK